MHEPKESAPVKRFDIMTEAVINKVDGTKFAKFTAEYYNADYKDLMLIEGAGMKAVEALVEYGHSRVPT